MANWLCWPSCCVAQVVRARAVWVRDREVGYAGVEVPDALGVKSGTDIRTVQELLGHSDVGTTMIYTHVLKAAAGGTSSPLDSLMANA